HQGVKRLNERIEQIAEENGIKVKFLSHRARHTIATFLNNAGADDVSITGIIGHSDVAFTKRQYANTQTIQLQRGMDKLSDYIAKIAVS
ncbi:MAG: tyrosine-type recombinase/integrase, partial [Clostridia bacterium]|nr:tyrosine-type recombinase/integrase [Clostridia bacterium]